MLGLLQVVVYNAASKLEVKTCTNQVIDDAQLPEKAVEEKRENTLSEKETDSGNGSSNAELSINGKGSFDTRDVFLLLPQSDLRNLCNLLGCEG